MNSSDLTTAQAAALHAQVGERLRWLNRLTARLDKLSFDPKDPLYLAAWKAKNAMGELSVHAHYASCKGGVGQAGRKE